MVLNVTKVGEPCVVAVVNHTPHSITLRQTEKAVLYLVVRHRTGTFGSLVVILTLEMNQRYGSLNLCALL